MQITHRFYKDDEGWFIALDNYPGSKYDLAMVAGADTFLDILAEGEDTVILNLSTEYINEGWEKLERTELIGGVLGSITNGAYYLVRNYIGIPFNHTVFLCPIALWVFNGKYPKTIYFTKSI